MEGEDNHAAVTITDQTCFRNVQSPVPVLLLL